jgi:hypothetical protein
MAKKQLPKTNGSEEELAGLSTLVHALFPYEKERTQLMQSALRRLHPENPKGDRFTKPINMAELIIEMQGIQRMRDLTQLIWAIRPSNAERASSLISGRDEVSTDDIAYLFGVSEGTVVNNWIPDGMPIN